MKKLLYAATALLLCSTQIQAQTPQQPRRDSIGGINNNNSNITSPARIGDTVSNPMQRRTPNTPINPSQPNNPGTPPVNTGSPVNSPGGATITPASPQR